MSRKKSIVKKSFRISYWDSFVDSVYKLLCCILRRQTATDAVVSGRSAAATVGSKTLFHGALDMSLRRAWFHGKGAKQRPMACLPWQKAYHALLMSRAFRGIRFCKLMRPLTPHRGRSWPHQWPLSNAICSYVSCVGFKLFQIIIKIVKYIVVIL